MMQIMSLFCYLLFCDLVVFEILEEDTYYYINEVRGMYYVLYLTLRFNTDRYSSNIHIFSTKVQHISMYSYACMYHVYNTFLSCS